MASFVMAPTANGTSIHAPPIIVHDLNGGHRAGTFCALYTFQDLIRLEGAVNVYEVAKMFHLKRPGIWQSQSNVMFLYKAVECLFDEIDLRDKTNNKDLRFMNNARNVCIINAVIKKCGQGTKLKFIRCRGPGAYLLLFIY